MIDEIYTGGSASHLKELMRSELRDLMKKGNSVFTHIPLKLLNFVEAQGYEINDELRDDLENWLKNIIDLDFVKKVIFDFHDNDIEEVIIHDASWIQIFGTKRKEFFGRFLSPQDYQLALEVFVYKEKVLWNERLPFQSFQAKLFENDWRITIIHPHLGPKKVAKLFLRSQRHKSFTLEDFGINQCQDQFIEEAITQKKNILVSGATGSGKTSFLQALLERTPKRSHIAILEDTHEIHLSSPFVTKLLAQEKPGFRLKDFCQYALRLRPDRIVLGEIRSHEVVPFLLSLNTGHGGMMASVHANSALDAIQRLCLLFQVYSGETGIQYQEILKLLCTGIDLIIHMENKRVTSILEIKGSEGMTPFYQSRF